jgi:hypothetical protein
MAQLTLDRRKAMQSVDQLQDTLKLLPQGEHFVERLWERPVLGATNSLLCAAYLTQADQTMTYQKLLQCHVGDHLQEDEIATIVRAKAPRRGPSLIVGSNEHACATLSCLVQAVATNRAPWSAMSETEDLLTSLCLKPSGSLVDQSCHGNRLCTYPYSCCRCSSVTALLSIRCTSTRFGGRAAGGE